MVEAVVLGTIAVVAVVVIVVERRIMRKPLADRSPREQRFLTADRRVATGWNRVVLRVAPWVLIVLGPLLLLLGVPFWGDPNPVRVLLPTLGGVASVAVGIFFLWFTRRHRGPDFWARQDAINRAADEDGRPRWFGWQK